MILTRLVVYYILLADNAERNRPFDGDLVEVQLLPKSEWKSILEDKEKDDGLNWKRWSDDLPTGRVVGSCRATGGTTSPPCPGRKTSSRRLQGREFWFILLYPSSESRRHSANACMDTGSWSGLAGYSQ